MNTSGFVTIKYFNKYLHNEKESLKLQMNLLTISKSDLSNFETKQNFLGKPYL